MHKIIMQRSKFFRKLTNEIAIKDKRIVELALKFGAEGRSEMVIIFFNFYSLKNLRKNIFFLKAARFIQEKTSHSG
jgi:hypothetical protein